MRQILVAVFMCSFLVSGYALALEALPAPKAAKDAKVSEADTEENAEEAKDAGEVKSKKRNKSKSKASAKSDDDSSDKEKSGTGKKRNDKDKEDKGDDAAEGEGESDDDSKKAEEKSKPEEDTKIQGDLAFAGDSRIKMLLYDESDVYTITTRYGYQTNVVFSPQEEIQLISVGDRSLWQIIPTGNRMFIRPMEEDVITNMTVITNKHSYQFDLKSLAADKSGNIYVAQFVYDNNKKAGPIIGSLLPSGLIPPDNAAVPSAMPTSSPFGVGPSIPGQQPPAGAPVPSNPPVAQQQVFPPVQTPPSVAQSQPPMPASSYPQALAPAPQPAPQTAPATSVSGASGTNYSYTYAGPDELAPLQVYDDGRSTYLKYRDVKKLPPAVYVVDASGKESQVAYSVKGDYMVIDVVAGELALRGNDNINVVHVFNEMLNPG